MGRCYEVRREEGKGIGQDNSRVTAGLGQQQGSTSSRRWRVVGVASAALALVGVVSIVSMVGGDGSEILFQMQNLRALQGAELPSYSPAALALSRGSASDLAKSVKDVQGIVEHEAQRRKQAKGGVASSAENMAGGTSLTKKQLAQIVTAARAAADKNNQLIYAADDALAASQAELGNDASEVSQLSSTSAAGMGRTFNSLIHIAASDKSKSTQAALAAATAAASKNRKEMEDAAKMMEESEEELGKDAVALPSLGDPRSGPSPLFKAVLKTLARSKSLARGSRSQDSQDSHQGSEDSHQDQPSASSSQATSTQAATASMQALADGTHAAPSTTALTTPNTPIDPNSMQALLEDKKRWRVNRDFLRATAMSHMLP